MGDAPKVIFLNQSLYSRVRVIRRHWEFTNEAKMIVDLGPGMVGRHAGGRQVFFRAFWVCAFFFLTIRIYFSPSALSLVNVFVNILMLSSTAFPADPYKCAPPKKTGHSPTGAAIAFCSPPQTECEGMRRERAGHPRTPTPSSDEFSDLESPPS